MKIISRRFRMTVFSLVVGAGWIGNPPPATARVIDDFTQGPLVSLQGTNTSQFGTTVVQSGLNPALVLGGTRSLLVGSLSLATASVETGKGRFHFTANQNYGYFQLDWGSITPLNANLASDGNSQFQLELVDSPPILAAAIFELRVKSHNTWFSYDIRSDLTSALHGQTFGVLNVPLTKFAGADFAQVQAIELDATRVTAGQHLAIDYFRVVPEPSATELLGLAALVAGWTRERS